MNDRIDEREAEALIQGYLESSLTEKESIRLHSWLRRNPAAVELILTGLRDDLFIRTVVAEWMVVSPGKSSTDIVQQLGLLQWMRMMLDSLRRNAWTTAAAGGTAFAALLILFSVWCFGPTMGTPVLAGVQGNGISLERSRQFIAPTPGTRLLDGDILRTSEGSAAVIHFAPEETRITLLPGTEFKLTSLSDGKHFDLDVGKLEASVARQRPFHPMIITTSQAEARVVGTRFTLTASASATRLDVAEGKVRFTRTQDAESVRVDAGHSATATANSELAALPQTGGLLREYWTNILGDHPTQLARLLTFPNRPDGSEILTNFLVRSDWGDNFGDRIRGYLHPHVTGVYRFWISGDGSSVLNLSRGEKPEDRIQIAISDGGPPQDWDRHMCQRSSPLTLTAGRRYYIEAIRKCDTGTDHLAVAWQPPGGQREIIPGEFLSPFPVKEKKAK